jgi:hypothetical protein
MTIGNRYELTVHALCGGGECITVHNIRQVGAETVNVPYDIMNNWVAGVQNPWLNAISAGYTLVRLKVKGLDDVVGGEQPAAGAGVLSGDMLPPQCAGVVTWTTGLIGRSNRGRTFVPGIPEGHQAGGVLSSTLMGLYDLFGAALISTFAGGSTDYELIVASNLVAGGGNAVTGKIVRPYVRSQRRREIGVGS